MGLFLLIIRFEVHGLRSCKHQLPAWKEFTCTRFIVERIDTFAIKEGLLSLQKFCLEVGPPQSLVIIPALPKMRRMSHCITTEEVNSYSIIDP